MDWQSLKAVYQSCINQSNLIEYTVIAAALSDILNNQCEYSSSFEHGSKCTRTASDVQQTIPAAEGTKRNDEKMIVGHPGVESTLKAGDNRVDTHHTQLVNIGTEGKSDNLCGPKYRRKCLLLQLTILMNICDSRQDAYQNILNKLVAKGLFGRLVSLLSVDDCYIRYLAEKCLCSALRSGRGEEVTEEWIQELVLYITTKGSCKKEKYRSECVINVFTKLAGSRPSNNESISQKCVNCLESTWPALVTSKLEELNYREREDFKILHSFLSLWLKLLKVTPSVNGEGSKSIYSNLDQLIGSLPHFTNHILFKKTLDVLNQALCARNNTGACDQSQSRYCDISMKIIQLISGGEFYQCVPYVEDYVGFGGTQTQDDTAWFKGDVSLLRKLVSLVLRSCSISVRAKNGVDMDDTVVVLQRLAVFVSSKISCNLSLVDCVFSLFGEQDDGMIESMLCLLEIYLSHKAKSAATGLLTFDPHRVFLQFLTTSSCDHTVLLDLLTAPETSFLLYFIKYLKLVLNEWQEFCAAHQCVDEPVEGSTTSCHLSTGGSVSSSHPSSCATTTNENLSSDIKELNCKHPVDPNDYNDDRNKHSNAVIDSCTEHSEDCRNTMQTCPLSCTNTTNADLEGIERTRACHDDTVCLNTERSEESNHGYPSSIIKTDVALKGEFSHLPEEEGVFSSSAPQVAPSGLGALQLLSGYSDDESEEDESNTDEVNSDLTKATHVVNFHKRKDIQDVELAHSTCSSAEETISQLLVDDKSHEDFHDLKEHEKSFSKSPNEGNSTGFNVISKEDDASSVNNSTNSIENSEDDSIISSDCSTYSNNDDDFLKLSPGGTPCVDDTMGELIRLRMAVSRLHEKELFPYNAEPLIRLLQACEDQYEENPSASSE